MGAVAFDTLEFVETLKDAGVPEQQAKAFSIVVRKSHEDAELATKQDITGLRYEMGELRGELHHKMDELRGELRHEMSDLRKDIDVKHESLRTEIHYQMSGLRHEMKDLRKDTDIKYESLRTNVHHQIKALELRLTIKLGTIVVAATGALPLLFRFLHLS